MTGFDRFASAAASPGELTITDRRGEGAQTAWRSIEFSPVFMEQWGLKVQKQKLEKVLFFFIALGTLLPMMHQSSLGTMLVVMGPQVNPLWQTPIVPLLYLLSAIDRIVGIALL